MGRFLKACSYILILWVGVGIGVTGTHVAYDVFLPGHSCLAVHQPCCPLDIKKCSVKIDCGGGHGSGTVGWLDGELYVLTAEHVAALGDKVRVGFEKDGDVGLWIDAECVVASIKHDLALLKLAWEPQGPWPELQAASGVKLAEKVSYCGWGGWAPLYYEEALVQNERVDFRPELGYLSFLVGGNGQAGNSGSAVWVVRKGRYELAGVILRGWANGGPIICIHPESLAEFLNEKPKEERGRRGWLEIVILLG